MPCFITYHITWMVSFQLQQVGSHGYLAQTAACFGPGLRSKILFMDVAWEFLKLTSFLNLPLDYTNKYYFYMMYFEWWRSRMKSQIASRSYQMQVNGFQLRWPDQLPIGHATPLHMHFHFLHSLISLNLVHEIKILFYLNMLSDVLSQF